MVSNPILTYPTLRCKRDFGNNEDTFGRMLGPSEFDESLHQQKMYPHYSIPPPPINSPHKKAYGRIAPDPSAGFVNNQRMNYSNDNQYYSYPEPQPSSHYHHMHSSFGMNNMNEPSYNFRYNGAFAHNDLYNDYPNFQDINQFHHTNPDQNSAVQRSVSQFSNQPLQRRISSMENHQTIEKPTTPKKRKLEYMQQQPNSKPNYSQPPPPPTQQPVTNQQQSTHSPHLSFNLPAKESSSVVKKQLIPTPEVLIEEKNGKDLTLENIDPMAYKVLSVYLENSSEFEKSLNFFDYFPNALKVYKKSKRELLVEFEDWKDLLPYLETNDIEEQVKIDLPNYLLPNCYRNDRKKLLNDFLIFLQTKRIEEKEDSTPIREEYWKEQINRFKIPKTTSVELLKFREKRVKKMVNNCLVGMLVAYEPVLHQKYTAWTPEAKPSSTSYLTATLLGDSKITIDESWYCFPNANNILVMKDGVTIVIEFKNNATIDAYLSLSSKEMDVNNNAVHTFKVRNHKFTLKKSTEQEIDYCKNPAKLDSIQTNPKVQNLLLALRNQMAEKQDEPVSDKQAQVKPIPTVPDMSHMLNSLRKQMNEIKPPLNNSETQQEKDPEKQSIEASTLEIKSPQKILETLRQQMAQNQNIPISKPMPASTPSVTPTPRKKKSFRQHYLLYHTDFR